MMPQEVQGIPSEKQYLNCIRCGACLPVCPSYRERLIETASPRGRVALARKQVEGEIPYSTYLSLQMYECFGCMACDDICPVGIQPSELVVSVRNWHEREQPSAWKQIVFDRVVAHPGRLETAIWPLWLYEKTCARRLASVGWIRHRLPHRMRDWTGMLPPVPSRPLRQLLPVLSSPVGMSRHRVGFFLGCAQSLLFAPQSKAALQVLARNACTVFAPREVVCCGMPALGYGRRDLAVRQARHNILLLDSAELEFIVTDCATCGSTLKNYGALLADDPAWAERAASFSRKVRDISEFLAWLPLERPKGRIEARVTYHDPCHLRRGQKIWRQPRDLLRLINGLEYVELEEADACCGSAGTKLLSHYELSSRVLSRKTQHLQATAAEYVTSGCPGCQMQLRAGIRRAGLEMRVVHPIELLDRAYRA